MTQGTEAFRSIVAIISFLLCCTDVARSYNRMGFVVTPRPQLALRSRATTLRHSRSPAPMIVNMKRSSDRESDDDENKEGLQRFVGSSQSIESTLQFIRKQFIQNALRQPGAGSDDKATSSGLKDEQYSNVEMSKEMIQEEVAIELEKARKKLATSAMRVAALQQRADQLREEEMKNEESKPDVDDDEDKLPEDEELAFQMGFNSIEYAAGTGTVTMTRQGDKTILTVEDKKSGKEGWMNTLTSFVNSLVLQKVNIQALRSDTPPAQAEEPPLDLKKTTKTIAREQIIAARDKGSLQGSDSAGWKGSRENDNRENERSQSLSSKMPVPHLVLSGIQKLSRAWYGNPKHPWRLKDPMLRKVEGKDVTDLVNMYVKASETGEISLFIPPALNEVFGDPVYGEKKDFMIDFIDTQGRNVTAIWSEGSLRTEPKLVYTDEASGTSTPPPSSSSTTASKDQPSKSKAAQKEPEAENASESRKKKTDFIKDYTKDPLGTTRSGAAAVQDAVGQFGTHLFSLDNITDLRANQWWKTVLWSDGTAHKEPHKNATTASVAGAPSADKAQKPPYVVRSTPPPIIPFIKYASPGPPVSEWTKEDCTLPYFRILSLDGGGVRGVLSAVILQRIVQEVPSFMDNVDMIAGTSTGGLIALMLAAGYSPVECQEIYEYGCPKIFAKDPWRVYNPLTAKYTAKGREELCRTYLGDDRTLKDLKKHVVITAFRLDGKVGNMGAFITRNGGWRPAVFSNIPKLQGDLEPDLNLYCWDAALRTSAAPTYFPVHRGYVDGAMFQNNPSMLGVTKACAHFPRVSPDNTVVLSVGAGNYPMSIPRAGVEDLDWGIKDWVPYIFDLMLDGDSLSCEVLMRYMLGGESRTSDKKGKRYHRIDPTLPTYMEMDDVDRIPELIELGKSIDLTQTIQFAQTHFSSSPTASDAFSQAAVRTASWAAEQAAKMQISDVIRSLTSAPSNIPAPWMGWDPRPAASTTIVPDIPSDQDPNIPVVEAGDADKQPRGQTEKESSGP